MGFLNKKKKNQNLLEQGFYKICENVFINEQTKKICLNSNIFNFSDIKYAKLVEDGYTKNMMAGNIGRNNSISMIAGMNTEMINAVNLEIGLNSFQNPLVVVKFLDLGIKLGFDKKSNKYKTAHMNASRCLNILNLIINKNNNS